MGEGQKQAPLTAGGGGGKAPPAGGGQTPQGQEADRLVQLRQEIGASARDLRHAFATIAPRGDSSVQIERHIQASSVHKSSGGASSRLCYVYTIPVAWELPRIRGAKKKHRAVPLLDDDFAAFADVIFAAHLRGK